METEMEISIYSELPPLVSGGHRGVGKVDPLRRQLMIGGPAGSSGNFTCLIGIGQGHDGHYPRHRHACDQIRFNLGGRDLHYDPEDRIPVGSVGYFPAGTYYGPYPGTAYKDVDLLIVQFEGAHRIPYISPFAPEYLDALVELKEHGEIKDGVYTWLDSKGQKHNQDGYEAAYEKVLGRKISYPKARYAQPIIIHPQNFSSSSPAPGVGIRELGTFTEAKTRLAMLTIDPGSFFSLSASDRTIVAFAFAGESQVGDVRMTRYDALRLDGRESAEIKVAQDSIGAAEFFLLELPSC
jgi:hypothetical protein